MELCITQLCSSSIRIFYITSIAHDQYTDIYPLLNIKHTYKHICTPYAYVQHKLSLRLRASSSSSSSAITNANAPGSGGVGGIYNDKERGGGRGDRGNINRSSHVKHRGSSTHSHSLGVMQRDGGNTDTGAGISAGAGIGSGGSIGTGIGTGVGISGSSGSQSKLSHQSHQSHQPTGATGKKLLLNRLSYKELFKDLARSNDTLTSWYNHLVHRISQLWNRADKMFIQCMHRLYSIKTNSSNNNNMNNVNMNESANSSGTSVTNCLDSRGVGNIDNNPTPSISSPKIEGTKREIVRLEKAARGIFLDMVSLHEVEAQAEYAKSKWGKVLWYLGLWFSVFAVLRLMVATYNLSKYLFFEYEGRTPPHYVEHAIALLQVREISTFDLYYLYIAVVSVSVEWCIGKPALIFLSSSITSYSSTSIAHKTA